MSDSQSPDTAWIEGIAGLDEVEAELRDADDDARGTGALAEKSPARAIAERYQKQYLQARSELAELPAGAGRTATQLRMTECMERFGAIQQFASCQVQIIERGYSAEEALEMAYGLLKGQAVLRHDDSGAEFIDEIAEEFRASIS